MIMLPFSAMVTTFDAETEIVKGHFESFTLFTFSTFEL